MIGRVQRKLRWVASVVGLLALVIGAGILILALGGKLSKKVPQQVTPPAPPAIENGAKRVPVEKVLLPRLESAVGTIRAVHETSLGSKLLARVVEVNLKAGQAVREGDVLIRLDDTDLRARRDQANAALASALATRNQAAADEKRYAHLVQSRAVSQQDYEKALVALRTADANVNRDRAAVNEVEAMLDWATIRSPINGTVIDKKVDVGDMVTPGQLLATLYNPKQMQLVASVRESLTRQLQIGQSIGVCVEGINHPCSGTIREIVPEAQSTSRTFQVKVTGPCPAGVYTGMFGRLQVPLGDEAVLVIPKSALLEVGQLTMVNVWDNGRATRRAIRVGRSWAPDAPDAPPSVRGKVEVLSGLREREQVLTPTP